MKTATPRMTNLFLQLGLDASESGIADFIGKHQLPSSKHLVDASYWNDAQRQFLSEQYKSDGDWAIIIDQLNESLHEDSVRRQTGL
ncbi:DUF2789 domain-containing protein [Kerstersia gyiorum]|uniref:Uncharacterized protein DUF2789 n=1 Tax=Kerstersia gyiorum TaxID=206506 RepID=A0A171KR82_9BURK|nr:DUF2789 domain-containing protein [Kerstersia gyiorum]MCO7642177.1 DUF2789 domain-containing protein [Pseudomonas sp. S 311-6]KAB0544533.1 DUF2789 domain-containing protein [Kerstersia gyiorum]KKO71399.1 hypothetical protein AAV32_11095 [Kerstersia gyiorum]MCH4271007.1 DUF2789 domain-containing protein [Kerstersia gyiorum]MCI1229998.1 DUF2789 domain-containing protein [Kerstersia gyiorum]